MNDFHPKKFKVVECPVPESLFPGASTVFRTAIVLMHNHPSGDPTPSEADFKVTRDLIRAG